jgi:amidase
MRTTLLAGACALALLLHPATAAESADSGVKKGIAALTAETPIPDLQAAMTAATLTSEDLTRGALALIAARNGKLHAVIALNPDAVAEARDSDKARKAGATPGPLAGIPVLIKDNIETRDRMATTAGSLALKDNVTYRDAPVVARLRAAGAVILGKTNLSEWANIRSSFSVSGWSAVGGLTANPYQTDRTACGSSSGSGAGIAADLAVIAVGTETDGSVTAPPR